MAQSENSGRLALGNSHPNWQHVPPTWEPALSWASWTSIVRRVILPPRGDRKARRIVAMPDSRPRLRLTSSRHMLNHGWFRARAVPRPPGSGREKQRGPPLRQPGSISEG
jgi:hypothetical protein